MGHEQQTTNQPSMHRPSLTVCFPTGQQAVTDSLICVKNIYILKEKEKKNSSLSLFDSFMCEILKTK